MDIQNISTFLAELVKANAQAASMVVAMRIKDEILTNTSASKGFGNDFYKPFLSNYTIKKKKQRGTYVSRSSTLRDRDKSIEKLRVVAKRGVSIIDFRSTGKGELFYAHHHGTPPPDQYEEFVAKRSIIPLKEGSVPMFIHEIAARSILQANGLPVITVQTTQTADIHNDWRSEVPF